MIIRKWTENGALRATHSRLNKINRLLEEVAHLWSDVDEGAVQECDVLRDEVEKLRVSIVVEAQERAERRAEGDAL